MICLFKGKIKSFEISPMGCFIDFNNINLNKIQRIIVYISGIVFNLILSFFLKDAYLLKYNNYLLIFNLLIIYPLDGYRVLEEVLDIFYEKEYLNRLMFIISIVCSITFFVLIFYIKYYGYLIILIYLNYKNYINYKSQRLKYKSEFYKNSFLLNPSVSK